ncbi:hypothetical protein CCAX7_64770 [Capsulimonas corticalis]|uniref:Uncharacterized protein n=1 Tax=Capsulimonas corticalis TaxID=2219043 RepID=A0A402CQL4_9BACT|nr:DUF1963 domain-containing protein [Capsulimonas corticalis]BDI34426.1 hypothetical protein CCAX7_64770 [Capsulimonas corticalis]
MYEGEFIHTQQNLDDRNSWLTVNAAEVEPFLTAPRDCTIFTYSRSEPSDRATTRYGGLPYWPKNRPWPICSGHGQHQAMSMPYVGQIDFRHTPEHDAIPGDVLVLHYCFKCSTWNSHERHTDPTCVLTWLSNIPDEDIIQADDLPAFSSSDVIGPFYGAPCITEDYEAPSESYGGNIAGESYTFLQFTLQGTKIGGYPPRIQDDSVAPAQKFLCAFGSIQPAGLGETGYHGDVCWGDMGSLIVYVSNNHPGVLSWSIQSY